MSMLHVESLSPLAHDKPVKMSATEHRKKLLKQQQQQPATGAAAAAAACNAQQYMSQSGSTLALNSSTEYEVNSPRTNAIPCGATSLTQPLLGGGTGPGSGTEDLFPRNQSESSNGATLAEATDPTPTSNGGAEAAKQSAEAQNTMMMQQKKQAEQLLAPTTNSAAGGVAPLSDHLYHREEEEKDDSAGSSPTSFGLELIGTHGPGGRLKIPEVEQPHSDPGADSLHSNHMLMVRHGNSIDDHATPKNRSSMTSLKKVSSRLTGERGSLPHTPVSSVDTSATGNDDDDDRSRTQSHSINSYTNSTNQKSTCSSKNSARAKMLFSNQLYILLEGNYLSKVGAKRWNQYRLLYERYRRSTQEQGQPPLRSRARDTILPASKPVDLEALTREAVEASERAFATRRSLLKCMIVALDEQVRLSHEVECAAMRKKAQRRQRRAQRAAGKGEELFPFIQLNPLYSLRVVADMADNPLMGGSPYCCSHTNEKH